MEACCNAIALAIATADDTADARTPLGTQALRIFAFVPLACVFNPDSVPNMGGRGRRLLTFNHFC